MPAGLRILTGDDVRRVLPMPRAIALMREAFIQLSSGTAAAPVRTRIDVPVAHGRVFVMPAGAPDSAAAGVKVVSVFDHNAARRLPLIHGVVLLVDAATGQPRALVEGASLTALRTGAASGLATDLLARPDAAVAAIFGAGAQARTQLEAVCAVRPIREALVYAPDPGRAAAFAAIMSAQLAIAVRADASRRELRRADVICTATTATRPVFAHRDVKPGAHINAIGAYRPETREIPGATVRAALVVVDHRASALAEAGDLLIPIARGEIRRSHIRAELGEIAAGRHPGRPSPQAITLFKSVGNAVQDVVAAHGALEEAERLGLGQLVEL
jgi:alanine dehydrogenase